LVSAVLALFILVIIGFIAARCGALTRESAAQFSVFSMNVTLPCMCMISMQHPFSWSLMGEAAAAFGLAWLVYGLSILIAFVYPYLIGLKGEARGVHRYGIIFSNVALVGYPIVQAILGDDYLFHLAAYNIPFNFIAFSLGAWLIAKEGHNALVLSWKTVINPAMAGVILGFIFFLFSIPLPPILYGPIKIVGDMTSPISMMVIGITLANVNWKVMAGRWRIYVTIAMRLLVVPGVIGLILFTLGIRGHLLILAVTMAAMPAGATNSILASLYHVAEEESSSLVFLSTLLSMVTIPLVVLALNLLLEGRP
jgi:predicted permease